MERRKKYKQMTKMIQTETPDQAKVNFKISKIKADKQLIHQEMEMVKSKTTPQLIRNKTSNFNNKYTLIK